MSKSVHSVKLQPYASSDLNRLAYSDGDVVYDQSNGTLRVMNGETAGGTQILRNDLANVKSTALNKSINFGSGVVTATRFVGSGIGAILGDTPPVPPTAQIGTLWFNTTSGKLYIYYNDGDSTQWIQPMTPSYSSGGGSAFTGGTVAGITTFSNTVNITGNIVSSATAVGNVIAFNYPDQSTFPDSSTYHGAILHSHADARMYMGHGGWQPMALLSDITTYTLPTATTSVLGGVKIDGVTLAFNGSGQLYYTGSGAGGYTLPTATTTVLGGVKVDGSTITINGSGVIMANYTTYSLPTATTTVLGGVKIDGSTVTINGSGVISSVSIPTYPAITRLDVTNNGSTAYLFNNQYSGNNPTIYAISGTTIAFNLNVSGHPFLIRQSGANFDTGLIHVSTTGVVSTGASAQGQVTGTLYWQIPQINAGTFGYLCQFHAGMVGVITIKQISSLP